MDLQRVRWFHKSGKILISWAKNEIRPSKKILRQLTNAIVPRQQHQYVITCKKKNPLLVSNHTKSVLKHWSKFKLKQSSNSIYIYRPYFTIYRTTFSPTAVYSPENPSHSHDIFFSLCSSFSPADKQRLWSG